jgi:release factor glutamine methyltransferase
MSKETVDYEPDLALYADNNGLSSYQAIIQNARDFLGTNGKLILEIGYSQKEDISDILERSGFKDIEVKSDLAGLDRVIIAS